MNEAMKRGREENIKFELSSTFDNILLIAIVNFFPLFIHGTLLGSILPRMMFITRNSSTTSFCSCYFLLCKLWNGTSSRKLQFMRVYYFIYL